MGVSISLWRARIGCFMQRSKQTSFKIAAIHVSRCVKVQASMLVKITLCIAVLLILCGDVETNPGPDTRQTKLSFKMDERKLHDELKKIMDGQEKLSSRIQKLEAENIRLKEQVCQLESQSRRDNLVFYGIPEVNEGKETWEESEKIVRGIMKDKLGLPEAESDNSDGIEIERAHRLARPRHSRNKSQQGPRPIIIKFSKFKQREKVKQAAFDSLQKDSIIKVKEDYSPHVRFIRWKLGDIMVKLRKANKAASLKFDKFVVDKVSYKFDDATGNLRRLSDAKLFNYDDETSSLIPSEDVTQPSSESDNNFAVGDEDK